MLFFTTIFYKIIAKHKNFSYLCMLISSCHVSDGSIYTFRRPVDGGENASGDGYH